MSNKKTATFLSLLLQIVSYYAMGLTIFVTSRMTYLLQHTTIGNIIEHKDSLPLLISNAGRFDLQAFSYIAVPMILPVLIMPYLCSDKAIEKFTAVMRHYFTVMLTLLMLLVTAETFYYDNFNSRYNVVFFDFFDEGPWGLMLTMWQDYPCLKILLGAAIFACIVSLIGKAIGKIRVLPRQWMNSRLTYLLPVIAIAITFAMIRGSVTRYTLQVEHFVVSTDETMNQSVPNALYLLKKAYKERKNSYKLISEEQLLREGGYNTLAELLATAGYKDVQTDGNDTESLLDSLLFARVDTSLSTTRPNVLLILNESWSNYLNSMDRGDSLDLLCTLRQHMQEDIVFNNFQSVRNGTIYTLETVTLGMPYLHFFNSRYRFNPFPTSIAHPFKANGYSTTFITGMDPTWENVLEGLTHQHFDTIIGKQELLHKVEGSTTSVIGVYDEYLYSYLFDRMNSHSNKPQFILVLTTTNHPPFTFPDNMDLPPLTDLWYKSPMLTGDNEVLTKYGKGIQYANKSLGTFLDKFKKSPLAKNTIVAVTGDHNVRTILDYSNGHVDARHRHSVPLYLYLPQQYRPDSITIKRIQQRYGSHFDLLPTLATTALKGGTRYLSIGSNLLDTELADSLYFSYNEKQTLSPEAANNDSITKMMLARELLMKLYYQLQFAKNSK